MHVTRENTFIVIINQMVTNCICPQLPHLREEMEEFTAKSHRNICP